MKVFLARQAIFDRSNNVVGYELLFRSGYENVYNCVDGNTATLNVIANSFCELNLKRVTDNKIAFINFTEELINDEVATILPFKDVVIEILEDVAPTDRVISACKKLKEQGFTLALDDFSVDNKYNKLIELIDIIKVDFLVTKGNDRKRVFDLLKINNKIEFLAEKIESIEEYNEAVYFGYTYFQGYYFSKPMILSKQSVHNNENIALKILKLVNNKDFNFSELESLILKDVGLSYKLTKLIKSSAYGVNNKVDSIKHGITFLGEKEIVKWLYVVILNDLRGNKPNELIKVSLQRAKCCELICNISIYKEKTFLAYITGLFSVMDAILNCSMESIVNDICLYDEVKYALVGVENTLNLILKVVINYEKGEWENAMIYAKMIEVDIDEISQIYLVALKWADSVQHN